MLMRHVICVIVLAYVIAFTVAHFSDPFLEQHEEYESQMQFQAERERAAAYASHYVSE